MDSITNIHWLALVLLYFLAISVSASSITVSISKNINNTTNTWMVNGPSLNQTGHNGHRGGLHIASVAYTEVRDPLIFTMVVLLAGISKIGYHHANFLSSRIPESCILVTLGTVFGAIIHFSGISNELPTFFEPHEFFIFLLPPIILEASFSLHDRTFMENIGSILLFAVLGTVLACVLVGGTLYGLALTGAMGPITDLSFMQIMVFSSLIVAVDPVAVLAVFNEIGVNHVLYFLVFGESLLNDGVTVVLYKVFQAYNVMEEINTTHVLLGILKFFVVCLGGLLLGVVAGIASAILTKHATHVKVAQPIIIFTMAYFGFLLAELFEFSGIISIIGCGLIQRQYAFHNISDKSRITISYFTKVISSANEIIIFFFLGLSIVNDKHVWHTGFTIWTIVICLVYRFIIIFSMSYAINRLDVYRVRRISFYEQFMIAYGGLRGAVCFSLVALLDQDDFPKNMFLTTTLAVIVFTVFVQGISIKPLVYMLQISLAPEKSLTMYKELNDHVTDHLMAGIEDIIGDHGRNHLRERLDYIDGKYLKPLLQVAPDPGDSTLKNFYDNLLLKEHYHYLKLSGAKTPYVPELSDNLNVLHHLRPRVNTETLLNTLTGRDNQFNGLTSKEKKEASISPSKEVYMAPQPASRSAPATPAITIEVDTEGALLHHGRAKRSHSVSSPIDARGLRSLLLSQQSGRMVLSKYDKNLTSNKDIHTEICKKTTRNRRLERLVSHDVLGSSARRSSWSDMETQMCEQRGMSHKAPPRHAMSVDLGSSLNAGDSLLSSGESTVTSLDHTSPLVPVLEEDEEVEMKPMISSDSKKLSRGSLKSSKYKLERQMGLDKTGVDSPKTVQPSEKPQLLRSLSATAGSPGDETARETTGYRASNAAIEVRDEKKRNATAGTPSERSLNAALETSSERTVNAASGSYETNV